MVEPLSPELDTLTPLDGGDDADRRRAQIGRWRNRSRMIRFFRRALPIGIVLILAGLVIAAIVSAVMARYQPAATQAEGVRLVNPRFYGRDDRGQAYVLAATEAVRDPEQESRIALTAPDMTLNSEGARSTRVQAERGVYDEEQKVLSLQGNVRLQDAGGFQFRTDEAVIDTKTNIVTGAKPLEGVGPTGRIAADSYAIYDQGARTRFTGRVRARLERGLRPAPQGETR